MNIVNYVVSAVIIAVMLGLTVCFFLRDRIGIIKGKDSALSGIWWISVFLLGVALYGLAYYQAGPQPEQTNVSFGFSVFINSLASSIGLFCFVFSYGTVSVIANSNVLYLIAAIILFVAGSLWTLGLMQKMFFKGITNALSLSVRRILPRREKTVRYVVIGSGSFAEMFLDNLAKSGVRKRLVTVITGDGDYTHTEDAFKHFVSRGYRTIGGRADMAAFKRAGVRADKNIRVVALTENDEENVAAAELVTDIIFKYVFRGSPYEKTAEDTQFQLSVISALTYTEIDKKKNPQEYERNKEEEDWRSKALKPLRAQIEKAVRGVKLKARIKYTFIERAEHFAFAQNAFGKLDFFNPYETRMREFFFKHPVTEHIGGMIDTSKARLAGEFNNEGKILKADGKPYVIRNIFVGFGRANYQALKWSVMTGQLLGCDYNAVVFDKNIKDGELTGYQAVFKNQSRGLFKQKNKAEEGYLPDPGEEYDIMFMHGDALSPAFYDDVTKLIKEADFTSVFIALGDDKTGLETACEIRQILRENDLALLDKVRIYAKIKKQSALSGDIVINNARNINARIETYGAEEEAYSTENVLGEEFEEYAQSVSNKRGLKWEFLSPTERDSNRHVAINLRTKLNLIGLDIAAKDDERPEVKAEEYSAAYGSNNEHVRKIIEERDKLKFLVRESYLKGDLSDETKPVADCARNNLARLEHLRWNTFHLVLGWTKKPISKIGAERVDKPGTDNTGRKNEQAKQHACITSAEGLIMLRKIQAEKMCGEGQPAYAGIEKAEAEADTLNYDFSTMDRLYEKGISGKKIVRLK